MCHFNSLFVASMGIILYWTFPNLKVAVDITTYHTRRPISNHRPTNLGGKFDYRVRMRHDIIMAGDRNVDVLKGHLGSGELYGVNKYEVLCRSYMTLSRAQSA